MKNVQEWWDNLPIWARSGVLFTIRPPIDRQEKYQLKICAGKEFALLTGFIQNLITDFYQTTVKGG